MTAKIINLVCTDKKVRDMTLALPKGAPMTCELLLHADELMQLFFTTAMRGQQARLAGDSKTGDAFWARANFFLHEAEKLNPALVKDVLDKVQVANEAAAQTRVVN